jgi:hypothetical protein
VSNKRLYAGVIVVALGVAITWFLWPQRSVHQVTNSRDQKVVDNGGSTSASTAPVPTSSAPVASKTVTAAAPLETVTAVNRNASWLNIQSESNLRPRISQALMSNKPEEAAAALNALLYCNNVASTRVGSPADVAEAEMLIRFPGDEKELRRSPVQLRYTQITEARKKCTYEGESPTKVTESNLRQGLSAKLADVNSMVRNLRQSDGSGLDLSRLNLEDRSLLASGRLDVLNRVIESMAIRSDVSSNPTPEHDVSLLLARHLAMCRLGDLCDAGSFRFAEICVAFGACDGANVQLSVNRLIVDDTMRLRTNKLAEQIVQNVTRAASRAQLAN